MPLATDLSLGVPLEHGLHSALIARRLSDLGSPGLTAPAARRTDWGQMFTGTAAAWGISVTDRKHSWPALLSWPTTSRYPSSSDSAQRPPLGTSAKSSDARKAGNQRAIAFSTHTTMTRFLSELANHLV